MLEELLQSCDEDTHTCVHMLSRLLFRLLGSKGFMGQTKLCKPGSHAYDEEVSKQLWEESAARAGVPVQPQA